MTISAAVDTVLTVANSVCETGSDGRRLVAALLYSAIIEQSVRDFRALVNQAPPSTQRAMRVARAICQNDHPDRCDVPVFPNGLPPMVHRVPVSGWGPLQVHPDGAHRGWGGLCMDAGCNVTMVRPLWAEYLTTVQHVDSEMQKYDAAAATVPPR